MCIRVIYQFGHTRSSVLRVEICGVNWTDTVSWKNRISSIS